MHKKWVPLYAALLLIHMIAGGQSGQAAGTSPDGANGSGTALTVQVLLWADSLSAQPEFAAWKNAEFTIVPIGPGQHGWLVTFRVKQQPVGYMIVNATEEGGFALGEYGAGSEPIFDPNTLYQAMVRQQFISSYSDIIKKPLKLERLYIHPLLAVWKWYAPDGQTYYLDAWSGDALPINDQQWQAETERYLAKSAVSDKPVHLSLSHMNQPFDPYERMPWLTQAPLNGSQVKQLSRLLDRKAQIRFTAELFEKNVLFVWPAIGYHRWNDETLFIAFEEHGTRYMPVNSLGGGSFFN
ncbi:hypothetical protein [Paenibacillus spongiae]|uniref:Uncharacterized protein n=1 Tax=Paenibacillus spongiae TaxID=2909671 RepID=A0ABY5S5V3_9BACL|nr:hypothetical protein [Paenibacillus spongiae]UVI27930.1 hypothetical protein L1F29_21030 [Paenibacillus spongiae]